MSTESPEAVAVNDDAELAPAAAAAGDTTTPEPLIESDLLVEDVSIDGMCGVY